MTLILILLFQACQEPFPQFGKGGEREVVCRQHGKLKNFNGIACDCFSAKVEQSPAAGSRGHDRIEFESEMRPLATSGCWSPLHSHAAGPGSTAAMIRIANGQGFWGDWLEAPVRLRRSTFPEKCSSSGES